MKHSIDASGLSLTDAAKRLGVTRQTLSRVINGRTSLSPEMAVRVSKAFGSTVEHWMRMQMAYDLAAVEKTARTIKVKRFPEMESSLWNRVWRELSGDAQTIRATALSLRVLLMAALIRVRTS